MHGVGSNGIYYSTPSEATVVEFWPSFRWEVSYLLACLTVNYPHLSSSYGPAGLASGVSPSYLYRLYTTCAFRCCLSKAQLCYLLIVLSGCLDSFLARTCYLLTKDLCVHHIWAGVWHMWSPVQHVHMKIFLLSPHLAYISSAVPFQSFVGFQTVVWQLAAC